MLFVLYDIEWEDAAQADEAADTLWIRGVEPEHANMKDLAALVEKATGFVPGSFCYHGTDESLIVDVHATTTPARRRKKRS